MCMTRESNLNRTVSKNRFQLFRNFSLLELDDSILIMHIKLDKLMTDNLKIKITSLKCYFVCNINIITGNLIIL